MSDCTYGFICGTSFKDVAFYEGRNTAEHQAFAEYHLRKPVTIAHNFNPWLEPGA